MKIPKYAKKFKESSPITFNWKRTLREKKWLAESYSDTTYYKRLMAIGANFFSHRSADGTPKIHIK